MTSIAPHASLPCPAPACPVLMVGQDSRGHWLVQDDAGTVEGFFVSRKSALGFARAESEWLHARIEMASSPMVGRISLKP